MTEQDKPSGAKALTMDVLKSRVSRKSEEFQANSRHHQTLSAELSERLGLSSSITLLHLKSRCTTPAS